MATITAKNYGLWDTRGVEIQEITEAASQSFVENALVLNSSETAVAVASDAVAITGLALKAATNVTTGMITIPVAKPTSKTKVVLQVMNNTTACAGSANYIGVTPYALTVASGIAYVDISDTSNDAVRIVAKHPDDAHSDTNCRYICQFLDSVLI